MQQTSLPARIILEDGSEYQGRSIGAEGTAFGEVVFNTSCTGYQEILTDPSYRGQMVLMTYPEIGNYGINTEDFESKQIHAAGFIVRRLHRTPSSWRSEASLDDFLRQHGIVGIEGVDTRAMTRTIRTHGCMKAVITTEDHDTAELLEKVKQHPSTTDQGLVALVTTEKPYELLADEDAMDEVKLDHLAVVDLGMKRNILFNLRRFVRKITVLPANANFEDIAKLNPDGVFLSNGPGDPRTLTKTVDLAKQLIAAKVPTFGICLGHQILSVASGAKVVKMAFGHHGGNHPVKDLETGKITITAQNHSFAADFEAFPDDALQVTHLNLNDGSIEGIRHKNAPMLSVQFHPEASPGPHDAQYLFARFIAETVQGLKPNGVDAPVLAHA